MIGLLAQMPGINGFLGTRGSLMLDVVFVAMFLVVPVTAWSIWLVRSRRQLQLHKTIQVAQGVILLATVAAFEIEVRITGWVERAQPSPYWVEGRFNDLIDYSLALHLLFAIPTPVLWAVVIVQALAEPPPRPVAPCPYSQTHKFWGRIAAASMLMTAVTGWVFYWLAFAAT